MFFEGWIALSGREITPHESHIFLVGQFRFILLFTRIIVSAVFHQLKANELPSRKEIMHLIFTPMLAIGTASSGAAFIVILAIVAAFRGK